MATLTPKYELQKKEDNDFYNIEDLNANWDKVENALTEFDDSGTAEGIGSFTDMLTKLVTGNKLAVTLRNLKAGLQFVLHAGSIVNNCVTDNAKLPLSAAQGKVLQDAITKLNSDLKVIYYSALAGTDDSVVPSNTQTVAYSFNVDAGVYIAFANVRWSSNAKGSRHIGFAEKTTESFSDMNAHYSIVAPSTDGMTFQNLAVILKYENPAHVEIRVQQFSGSDLKIQTRLSLLKVK